ncbi:hypothetical protein ACFXPA_05330 [Amycolatopsis sp. NPDC059090]|uniref:hypothetical protein n=1 Tax=unclassified Amycolatopsis TaxID=2618356 RepID=UPI00366F296D
MDAYSAGRGIRTYLPRILLADAIWDVLLGVVLVLSPWRSLANLLGLSAARPWPVFVVLGVGSFAFSGLLVRGALGTGTAEVCRAAAIANTAAVVAVIVLLALVGTLGSGWALLLGVAGAGCAVFAVLEWAGIKKA